MLDISGSYNSKRLQNPPFLSNMSNMSNMVYVHKKHPRDIGHILLDKYVQHLSNMSNIWKRERAAA
jgi:hypothetical protein